ncbi:hypothetical protein [Yimella sp. cx-51]|uniref:hypothetical protein n=1 Tax=Yimella sp. cx-51 TaxID=2770551 RepID=UPI00165DE0F9|nr:hypothetical protein [Yimella sp. cx-51]MBC9957161.1 hypothetical protein [Yimella sp. cx-51]QTH37189.1 hypothetical protein J5M86_09760 [Yimella sp. cx-51]
MTARFDLPRDKYSDPAAVEAELARGADLFADDAIFWLVMWGSPQTLALALPFVEDIDRFGSEVGEGRTLLWTALFAGKHEMAAMLHDAGADPWLDQMGGWSPGRLALAGPAPDLFDTPPERVGLTRAEIELIDSAARSTPACTALADAQGWSLCAVACIDSAEALRRLQAIPAEDLPDDPRDWPTAMDGRPLVVAHETSGGCLLLHPCSFEASMPGVLCRVASDTRAYAVFDNAARGRQAVMPRTECCKGGICRRAGCHGLANTPARSSCLISRPTVGRRVPLSRKPAGQPVSSRPIPPISSSRTAPSHTFRKTSTGGRTACSTVQTVEWGEPAGEALQSSPLSESEQLEHSVRRPARLPS